MSTRHVKRRDANHGEIVSALERCGWSVLDISQVGGGAPDLLVGYHGRNVLCEIKTGRSKLRAGQEDWHAGWRGDKPVTLRGVDDAFALAKKI